MNTESTKRLNRLALLALCGVLGAATAWGQATGRTTRRSATSSSAAGAYPSSTDIGEATISYDPETREIIVVTDDETAQHVQQVVASLDRPAPQVLIKVVFMEALYNKDLDVGVDGKITHEISSTGINGSQNPVSGIASSLLGLASPAVGPGGFYQVIGDDLEITIQALAKAGKTEILSRPSILARNNQPAIISLGQQVPLVTNTRFDNFGNQINSVTYQDVGIILEVTPFITSQGLVELTVSPQTSELADRSQWVPISTGGTNAGTYSAPVINSRSADTVVIVPDRQTVVIGGLLQNKRLNSETKIPILGDIPLLGFFFRHKVTANAKAELLIFLTPQIVEHPSMLAGVTRTERDNTRVLPEAFTPEEQGHFLDETPPAAPAAPAKKRPKW